MTQLKPQKSSVAASDESSGSRLVRWLRRCAGRRTLMLVGAVLFTELVYVAVISVGKFNLDWPIQMWFYDQLADGFRAGQLHLPYGPHPYLQAQANPYDPAFMRWWQLDASYYRGRYYIYWGPVPAVIQAIGKTLLDVHRVVGDQYLVFLFFSLMTVLGAILIARMARRLATGIPPWLVVLMTLGLGLANPVTHLLASAGVYQAAISGSQAFLYLGIIFAFDAVWEPTHGRRRVLSLLLAGVAWSAAIGCRISVVLAIAPIVLCTLACTRVTDPPRLGRFVRDGLWVSTPVVLSVFVLLCYNKLRFDEWLEFGVKYQLSAFPFRGSLSYVFPNVESYFLRAPKLECEFPYLFATVQNSAGPISRRLGLPQGYLVMEPTVGMLYVVPLVYSMPVAIVAAVRRAGPGLLARQEPRHALDSRRRRAYVWLVICLLFAAMGASVVSVTIYFATMRYLSDFTNACVFLGILGLFAWYGRPTASPCHRRLRVSLTVGMVAVTMTCGVLLGYQGYVSYFMQHNPELHQRLVASLSVCGDR
ncbi:hypothetical protein ACFL5O_09780 [Myxococcota bacterium]